MGEIISRRLFLSAPRKTGALSGWISSVGAAGSTGLPEGFRLNRAFVTALAVSMLTLSIISTTALAHEMELIQPPEDVVNSILAKQGISDVKQVDCSKVSDKDFEELGEAVMERMAGSHELHEQMDVMMGGEGSASLQQMHIAMGQNWLGCQSLQGAGMMGMMNANMMPMMMRMMGNYYPAYYSGYDVALILGIAGWILFFLTLTYLYFTRKSHKRAH